MKPITVETTGKRIPVSEVKQSSIMGLRKDLDSEDWADGLMAITEKKRETGRTGGAKPQPKLDPIENRSMLERIADFGLAEG